MAECEEEFDEGERGEWESCLETQHSKTKIMTSNPITSWQKEVGKVEAMTDFIFLGSKIPVDGDCSHEIKRCLINGRNAMTKLDSILKAELSLCWQKSI